MAATRVKHHFVNKSNNNHNMRHAIFYEIAIALASFNF